jgi:hypothetical protein
MIKLIKNEKNLKILKILARKSLKETNELIEKNLLLKSEIVNNLKFLKNYHNNINRSVEYFNITNFQGSIFEIGPGSCYFLYLCKQINKCSVSGVDLESPIFKICQKNLSIDIKEYSVCAFKTIPFEKKHNYIVSFLTMFNSGWGISAHKFWLEDCLNYLKDEGEIILHFNKRCFHKEIQKIYKPFLIKKNIVKIKKNEIIKII